MKPTLATVLACALVLGCACAPAAARGAPSVRLTATLTPERLGQGTTIAFEVEIAAARGRVPPPLSEIELRYPSDLGIATSGLGIETCAAATLEASGPGGCPPDSVMGSGSALAEIAFGPEMIDESALVTILRAPTRGGRLALLLYVNGATPVEARIVLPSLLLAAPAPFGGLLDIGVPLVPSLPGAPPVAVVRLRATIGAGGITYYERVRGRTIAYHPRGVQLPDRCPRGGFPFAARLRFADGSAAGARAAVPCPRRRR